jgi:ABC-type histidine transport system ATPase subunit
LTGGMSTGDGRKSITASSIRCTPLFLNAVPNHVMFLHQGRVEEEGPPAEVFGNTKSERLRQFLAGSLK